MTATSEGPVVEVFTQTHCASCRQVEQYLRDRKNQFVTRDVGADPAALEAIASRGYMSTPVTRIGDEWIAGFKRATFEKMLRAVHSRPAAPNR